MKYSQPLTACCFVIVCVAAVGCPTEPGGDPAVWQETTFTGNAQITEFDLETNTISFQFEREDDTGHTESVADLKLSSISDLPDEYSPSTGDILKLKLHARYKRKRSVGPPEIWKSKLDQRTIKFLELTRP